MARDPGSVWSPLPESGEQGAFTKTQFITHSTGSRASAANNWDYFAARAVTAESTFIVGLGPGDPTLQILDSTEQADANLSANRRAISVEVVGLGTDPFTDWQISELIRLGRWAHQHHGIPLRVCPAHDQGGYGWHVMFGAPGPWTAVVGKVCPGAKRIAQLQALVFPAIFNHPTEDDDMTPDQDKALADALSTAKHIEVMVSSLGKVAVAIDQRTAQLVAAPDDVDEDAIAQLVLVGLSPEAIAAAIPTDLAERVADELAARLTKES